jgi:hypothetical protein
MVVKIGHSFRNKVFQKLKLSKTLYDLTEATVE